jgi:hypothetical protein
MFVVEKKMIDGKMRTIKKKIVPVKDIPTLSVASRTGFAFMLNPEKKNLTKNTVKTYKSQLNKMSGALGYTTAGHLITKHKQILAWSRTTYPEVVKRKLFLSSVFYILNQKPFIKMGVAKPYYDEFQKLKKAEITTNARAGTINKTDHLKALVQIGIKHWKH